MFVVRLCFLVPSEAVPIKSHQFDGKCELEKKGIYEQDKWMAKTPGTFNPA